MKQSDMVKIFKALSSEQRLNLFTLIYDGFETFDEPESKRKGCCPGIERAFSRACEYLNLSRSTISHHFKELQNAGLIRCERRGQSFYCEVNEEAVEAVRAFLK